MKKAEISNVTIIQNKIDVSKYGYVSEFHEGLACVCLNTKQGYINSKGEEVIKPWYDYAGKFYEGLAKVEFHGKFGVIDKTGKEIVKPRYDFIDDFHEDLAKVKFHGKFGFINKEGEEVVGPKYDLVGDFYEGLAWVRLNDKFGYVNKEGKEVVKPKYDNIDGFQEGLAAVKLKGKWGLINKEGNEIIDCSFFNIKISDGMIVFNNEYIVDIKTMKLTYACVFESNGKAVQKEFDNKEKRNQYLNEIKEYIKDKETETDAKIENIKKDSENKIRYVDEEFSADLKNTIERYYKK